MKQVLCLVLLGLILSIVPPLYAQNRSQESSYNYTSVPIERIYVHREGYVISYRIGRNLNDMTNVFIPHEWFTNPAGKAEIVLVGTGNIWPRMTLYYRDGVFSHVRIVARRDTRHSTWGVAPVYLELSDRFRGVEEIHLEY